MDVIMSSFESLQILLGEKFNNLVKLLKLEESLDRDFDASNCIGVCENRQASELLSMAQANSLYNVVQTDNQVYEREVKVAGLMKQNPQLFFTNPVSSVFSPENPSLDQDQVFEKVRFKFNRSDQKAEALERIESELRKWTKSESTINDARLVADELFTNAVFNAPFVDADNSSSGASRNLALVEMEEGHQGELFLGTDGQYFVIGCSDPYGKLNVKKLIERVQGCYLKGLAESMNMGEGGAGIGCFMCFQASTSYFAAVTPGNETLVLCMMPLKMSQRKKEQQPKNFHFMEFKNKGQK